VTQFLLSLLIASVMTVATPADVDKTPGEAAREWALKGVSLLRRQEYEPARNCFTEALRINRGDALALLGRGISLNGLQKYKDAEKNILASIEADSYCPFSADAEGLRLKKEEAQEEAVSLHLKDQLGLEFKAILTGRDEPSLIYARVKDPTPLVGFGLKKVGEHDLVALLHLGNNRWKALHLAEKDGKNLYFVELEDESRLWQKDKPKEDKRR
jgi:tetratricopeptide (TPR) repeat protein